MFQKHIHKAKFYPSADDFTQAPLLMLVTNIMSAGDIAADVDQSHVGQNKRTSLSFIVSALYR